MKEEFHLLKQSVNVVRSHVQADMEGYYRAASLKELTKIDKLLDKLKEGVK